MVAFKHPEFAAITAFSHQPVLGRSARKNGSAVLQCTHIKPSVQLPACYCLSINVLSSRQERAGSICVCIAIENRGACRAGLPMPSLFETTHRLIDRPLLPPPMSASGFCRLFAQHREALHSPEPAPEIAAEVPETRRTSSPAQQIVVARRRYENMTD